MMAVASATVALLRAAPTIITARTAVAATAARGMLHARTEITAYLRLPRLLSLWRLAFSGLIFERWI